jgi:transcriptional regulator with XRE-family HTH domain
MSNPTQKCDAQALFAANMRRIRKAKELTQEKVAEAANLHPNYVSSAERGERNISICNIDRIARALGVTMSELVASPVRDAEPAAQASGNTRSERR